MAPRSRRFVAVLFCALVACGHKEEKVGVVSGPPLTIAPPAASDADANANDASGVNAPTGPNAPDSSAAGTSPVTATFIDLSATGAPLRVRTCEQVVVTVVRGKGTALGDALAEGDFLVTQGEGALTVQGTGFAVVAAVRTDPCTPRAPTEPAPPLTHRTLRARAAPELTWAGGKMHAHLDVEDALTGAYAGRTSGTAPVPEHAHEGTWEILCAIDAKGTVTIDGQAKRVGPRQVVIVPPSAKHAYTPDEGSTLSAVQFYWPRGPEQRFRELDRKEHTGAPARDASKAPKRANSANDANATKKVRHSLP